MKQFAMDNDPFIANINDDMPEIFTFQKMLIFQFANRSPRGAFSTVFSKPRSRSCVLVQALLQ